jgi:hypothetical protein
MFLGLGPHWDVIALLVVGTNHELNELYELNEVVFIPRLQTCGGQRERYVFDSLIRRLRHLVPTDDGVRLLQCRSTRRRSRGLAA